MGQSAIDKCYEEKDLDECEKLHRIQNTLSTWCAENDQYACEVYGNLYEIEAVEQMAQSAEDAFE